MSAYILLALLNGVLISVCRAINGRLSKDQGPFIASFYNHFIGVLVLTIILVCIDYDHYISWHNIPEASDAWPIYMGGVIGAMYVAINSHIISKIGALKTALFVVSGQMFTGVMFDLNELSLSSIGVQLLGVALIVFGIYYSQSKN